MKEETTMEEEASAGEGDGEVSAPGEGGKINASKAEEDEG